MKTRTPGPDAPPHKFEREQRVQYEGPEEFPPVMEVAALLPGYCTTHDAPYYGCVHGGDHFTVCEVHLKPLSDAHKRRMN